MDVGHSMSIVGGVTLVAGLAWIIGSYAGLPAGPAPDAL